MPPQNDLLRTVKVDLIYLREAWDQEADDDRLRRDSAALRRLLHRDLREAWVQAGFGPNEPRIEASTLQPLLDTVPLERIFFAAAGGAQYKGATQWLPGLVYDMTEEEIQRMYAAAGGNPPHVSFGLEAFKEAPAVVVQGTPIPRRVLIKYVCEKLGGAHHDAWRGDKREGLLYAKLDEVDTLLSQGKPAIYFELLSAGQAITRSPDIEKLMSA